MEKCSFKLQDAQKLFKYICEQMSQQNIVVTNCGRSGIEQKETATFYLAAKLDENTAIGSVQYYGGKKAIEYEVIRVIELRFDNNFINKMEMGHLFNGLTGYNVFATC